MPPDAFGLCLDGEVVLYYPDAIPAKAGGQCWWVRDLMLDKRLSLTVQREKNAGDLSASQAPYLAWSLIMLDRCIRGMHNLPTEPVYLYGTSPDWLQGEIEAVDVGEVLPPADALVWRGDDGSDEGSEPHCRVRINPPKLRHFSSFSDS